MICKAVTFFCLLIFVSSCGDSPKELARNQKSNQSDNLVTANKYLLKKDADIVNGYIKRRNWKMEVTQTGLWYMIYEKGTGKKVTTGNRVSVKYTVSLLDGTSCYSSDKDGLKSFTVGKGGVERGLEEGVLLMQLGDKARFIMLPHLAYGLIGDQNCIPPRATVLYEVELVQIAD